MSAQIKLTRNDTLPKFGGEVDFDLTGYIVTLHIKFPAVLTKTATILTTSESSSTFEFVFETGDLSAVVGTYDFEIQFDDGADPAGIITYYEDENEDQLKLKLRDEIA